MQQHHVENHRGSIQGSRFSFSLSSKNDCSMQAHGGGGANRWIVNASIRREAKAMEKLARVGDVSL